VALKTAAAGVVHKSEVGGVRLGLAGPEELAAAYADLAGRLGPRVLVAAMAPRGRSWPWGWSPTPSSGRW
jgi:acetate---CoA ligase (ADP-forming)